MQVIFDQVTFSYAAKQRKPLKRAKAQKKALEHIEFDSSKAALKDVSLTIESGEFFGVIGHTGSGKSTFIRHLNGIAIPTQGSVTVGGLSTAIKEDRAEIRSKIGMVFQYPDYQLFAATVAEDIAYGPRNFGVEEAEIAKRITQVSEMIGLDYDALKERSPFELSGGQKRLVAIAGVLVMQPEILVLDEPTAALDPRGKAHLLQILRKLNEQGMTIIMVSHNMDDVAEDADRVLVLDHGSVFALGTPAEVFQPANAIELRRIGLGIPEAAHFAQALQAEGFPIDGASIYREADLLSAIEAAFGGETRV
jgi:energy-coupling factor transporter ATPase